MSLSFSGDAQVWTSSLLEQNMKEQTTELFQASYMDTNECNRQLPNISETLSQTACPHIREYSILIVSYQHKNTVLFKSFLVLINLLNTAGSDREIVFYATEKNK